MRPGIVGGDVPVSYWPIFLLGPVPFMLILCKLKHSHAQNGIFDSILDTNSPQPNDKQVLQQDSGQSVCHIAFHMFA